MASVHRGWISLVMLACAAAPSSAEPLAIAWQVPAGCPDVASVRARIAQRVGDGAAYFGGMSVAVAIEHVEGMFVAHIDLGGLGVTGDLRSLTSTHCDEIADAVAVIVASIASGRHPVETGMATDELRGWPIGDSGERDGLAHDNPVATTTLPPARASRAPVAWHLGGRIATVGGIGSAPGVSAGGELVAFAQRGTSMLELGGTYAPVSGDAGHVTFSRTAASVRIGWRAASLPLRAWAVGEVGSLMASDLTIDVRRTDSGRTVSVGAGVAGAWHLTSLVSVVVSVEQLVAIERLAFAAEDGASIYATSRATTRASLGIEVGW